MKISLDVIKRERNLIIEVPKKYERVFNGTLDFSKDEDDKLYEECFVYLQNKYGYEELVDYGIVK